MADKKRKRSVEFKLRATEDEANKIRQRFSRANKKTFQAYAYDLLLEGKIETYDYSELQK